MDRSPPNPYRDRPLPELEKAMQRRAGELLKPDLRPRTSDERRDFARDTGYLLLAAAFPLMPASGLMPCTPERAIRQGVGSFRSEFFEAYEQEAKWLRYQYLCRAKALHQTLYGVEPDTDPESRSISVELFREALAKLDKSASTLKRKV